MKFWTACFAMALVLLTSWAQAAGPRDGLWKEVDEAVKKGLPKTAIEKLQPILKGALEDKKYAEAVKAIGKRITLEGQIQGNKPEERITRLRAEIDSSPAEMQPVLEAILANWYWHYFQQNRWRFLQRTQTAAAPSDDFTTWDLPRIYAEIDQQFRKALAAAETLKKIPIADYDDLLEKGNSPDAYRPTLYDFVAHNALEFYASGEQAAARAEDAFELNADSPVFASVDQFLAWKPESSDDTSRTLKAIQLYQDLIGFHLKDDDRSAVLDADLSRLEFGHNKAFGEEKTARYKAAMKRFEAANPNHEISARALLNLATAVQGEGDSVEARQIAQQGLTRFPDSVGGRRCFNLIQQIEARSSQVTTERVWNPPLPTIDVRYRNVTKIYFRVVAFDFEQYLKASRWQPEQLDQNQRQALLAQAPIKAWSADLPATTDYQERSESLAAPADIKAGSYFLITSHNDKFDAADNQVSFAEFWVSQLALVLRSRNGAGVIEGFVLNAISGEPLPGAVIRAWHRGNNGQLIALEPTKTGPLGLFRFEGANRNTLLFHATHDGQTLSSASYVSTFMQNPPVPYERTMFFTDRSLYRPGQTIRYKGICLAVDTNQDSYRTIPARQLTVIFADANGKEIERVSHQTNDYGSFNGSVTAPRDRLTGRMFLRIDGQPQSSTNVSVEEYKRPKFQSALEAPKDAPKLGGEVSLTGKATAYTGAAIDGAKVRWRVVRQVRYPLWWSWRCWWMPPQSGASQEIAHGSAITESNGSFKIQFTAKPDLSVAAESEPTFQYTISADVTDTTGETRSASRTINVGYTALAATLTSGSWLTDEQASELSVRTTTLDGEGQSATGVLKIYALKQPDKVQRATLSGHYFPNPRGRVIDLAAAPKPDPANPNSWALGEVVFEQAVVTDAGGNAKVATKLAAGIYRAKLETKDRFGKAVTAELPLQVLDPDAGKLSYLKIPQLVASAKASVEPGEEFSCVWGSGYETARAFVEVEHRGKLLQSFWTEPGATQVLVKQKIDEAMRGGFTLRTTMVRENRAYLHSQRVDVPWSNKTLTLKWEHFVSKLEPAQKETWTAVVSGPDAKHAVAELVAAMYDASLDAYQPHNWAAGFGVFRLDHSTLHSQFENQQKHFQYIHHGWNVAQKDGSLTYRHLPADIVANFWAQQNYGRGGLRLFNAAPQAAGLRRAVESESDGQRQELAKSADYRDSDKAADGKGANGLAQAAGQVGGVGGGPAAGPDLSNVSARKNLNETAFFFPHLLADKDGSVKLEFTMPEALTEWKFLGFAHDNQLRGGLLTDKVVTSKELMIQPNPPRFLREGDVVEFTVKVSNQSATRQAGQVRLTLADARTMASVDKALGNTASDQAFDIPSGESKSFSWKLSVPDDQGFLTYKAVGSTGRLSDGEEGALPVLSRRILVTESLPLPIRGAQTKKFDFTKLSQSGKSDSLKHKSLTVQMVSNPSWYAVLALPYLMESPHECTEQTFNRLYANSLARHIAQSDPKIHRVFEQWRGTPALDSPLEKNQDLKSVLLAETPWVRQAQAESQARRNVGVLFDDNRLNDETARLLGKLSDQQLADGRWPWFPGGPANDYMTLYIATGFGRLRHLGVKQDVTPALKSLQRLDAWADESYRNIPGDKNLNHLSTTMAFYLYGRSFFLKDQPVADPHKEAVNYWLGQAKKYWLELGHRQSQGHLAVALKRFGDVDTAKGIMASLKERSVSEEELGMYWREQEQSWWWCRAPIETQAMMIEAFDEVMNDVAAVEDCKVWLLKQKQTQDWKTTKATADAVYALLLRGSNLLSSDALVELTLGGETIKPEKVEAGTGYYEQRFVGGEIQPKLGQISVKKLDAGVAWGSVHWQYLEDMSKVTPHTGTPLKLTKQLYTKQPSKKGPVLEPVKGPVSVGDELVVRIVLRADRDMEYVHLKDYRGSGTEPVSVLSQYKYQDGLGYYESTRDTASHFFIDYLPKGTYVFEYSTRVQLRGRYQTGVASIQCLYAPEFNSHSESLPLTAE